MTTLKQVGRAAIALSCLVVVALVTPSLVLCESVTGHAAVEPMTSACCEQGLFGSEGTGTEPSLQGCGDACVDTPLITGAEPASAPSVASCATVVTAVIMPVTAPLPAYPDAQRPQPPPGDPPARSTVLRI